MKMLKLTIAQLLLMSQASHAVQLSQESTNAFSVKDIYKGLSQMTGFHMDVEKKPHIKQSLV